MNQITVIFAVADETERREFSRLVEAQGRLMRVVFPNDVKDVDKILKTEEDGIIVTDLLFQQGGFADWLFLWHCPFILLADYQDAQRIDAIVKDESSAFLIREPGLKHLSILPILARKVLNSRESINRQNYQIQFSERRYLDLMQALPDIVYSLDSQGRFVFVNDSVRSLGWQPFDLVGRHFSTLVHPEDLPRVSKDKVLPGLRGRPTGPADAPKLFDERRSGERRTRELEVRLVKKETGAGGEVSVSVTAYGEVSAVGHDFAPTEHGQPGTVGIIRDISLRRENERLMRQALREKTLLLREIHHRIKNNLQVVASLLSLQSRHVRHPDDAQLFMESQMQVRSMALMHEQLYDTERMDVIAMDRYIQVMVDKLYEIYRISPNRIRLELVVEELALEVNVATPVALLVNELVSNSFKYAFPGEAAGTISIGMAKTPGGGYALTIGDDGKGLPPDLDISNAETLGHQLVYYLVRQIGGEIERLDRPGTFFRVVCRSGSEDGAAASPAEED